MKDEICPHEHEDWEKYFEKLRAKERSIQLRLKMIVVTYWIMVVLVALICVVLGTGGG